MAALKASFEVLADGTMRVEMEITSERLGTVTVAAAGIVSVFYIFREPICNALRHPDFPHDEPVIEDIQHGPLIVKLHFLTPGSFLRFYDDYKSGKLQDSLAKEIEKLTTKPTPETATTMTVFDESLPVKFKESLEEKFKNLRLNDKLTVKIRDEEKVKNHAEKLRANTVEQQGRVVAEGRKTPCIIVQGGAYSSMLGDLPEQRKEAVRQSVKAGYHVLRTGGTAVDAVEKAIRILEDNPNFNAGRGSLLNDKCKVECDAMIMNGTSMETGAVMAVSRFPHPVSVAKCVMQRTKHCAMTNEGALDIAIEHGLEIVEPEALVTDEARDRVGIKYEDYEKFIRNHYMGQPIQEQLLHDTVTAVAMDENGHIACATSTGGIPGKMRGRVGDAPLVGCGGYANKYGGATTTGHGEAIMKMTLAREVIYRLEQGDSAQKSAEEALKRMETSVELGYGGVTVIDRHGNFGKAFNTKVMVWASIKDDELKYGMELDECHTIRLSEENV